MKLSGITAEHLEILFREEYSRLYYYAYGFVAQQEASEDIVSEVFEGVWKNRDHIDTSQIKGYLIRATRNQCINYLRQLHPAEEMEQVFNLEEIMQMREEDLTEQDERVEEIERVIQTLPLRTRYVLEACYYDNRSYQDVAEELNITRDGVKMHIVKALKTLREHFNKKK